MRRGRRALLLIILATLVLALPAVTHADHVSIGGVVNARVKDRASSLSWRIEVRWTLTCAGAASASYTGNLYLVDVRTNERIYMGGVFSGSGTADQLVGAQAEPRLMVAEIRVSCFDNGTLHGSNLLVAHSTQFLVPARYDDGEGSAGGGGGGGGGGRGSGGRGNDDLRGEGGDDRLTGGTGNDRLAGGAGLNAYDAGPGNDSVDAVNRKRDTIRCGSGRDTARADRRDRVSGCERVRRVGR